MASTAKHTSKPLAENICRAHHRAGVHLGAQSRVHGLWSCGASLSFSSFCQALACWRRVDFISNLVPGFRADGSSVLTKT